MAWDSVMRRSVMFGGEQASPTGRRADTWAFTSNLAAAVGNPIPAPNCGGRSGTAVIGGFGTPVLGNPSFSLDLNTQNPPTPSSPVFFLLSLTQGTAMFGPCQLVVDPATLFVTSYRFQVNGLASLPLPIPGVTNLLGGQFYAQCMYIDPPSALNGIAFSAGAQITIGDF